MQGDSPLEVDLLGSYACSPGKMSKKVEVIAIKLFFALSTSKKVTVSTY